MCVCVCVWTFSLWTLDISVSISLSLSLLKLILRIFSWMFEEIFPFFLCVCVCVVLSPEKYKPQETDEIGWRFSYSNGPPFQSSVVCSATWGRRLTQSHWQTRDHADQIISHWPCCVFYTENVAAALCVHCDIHGVGVHYLSRAATNR